MDSWYIFKVEGKEFVDGWDEGYEKKREVKDDYRL